MALGNYVGDTSYRVTAEEPFEDSRGVDGLRITLRGDRDDYQTTFDGWTRGKVATTLGYPNLYLQFKRGQKGNGSMFCTIELEFAGFITTTLANPTRLTSSIIQQSVTLTSDETDTNGDDQNVQCSYYAEQTDVEWIYRGTAAPTTPRYPISVASTVPTGILFNKFPPNYTGTLQAKNVGILSQFSRDELATGVWVVRETWINRIEPDT